MSLVINQTKYGWKKAVNFAIDQCNPVDNRIEMYSTQVFCRNLKKQNLQIYDFNIEKYGD